VPSVRVLGACSIRRTFEDFASEASQEACVYFARQVTDWESEKSQPPPFNALRILSWPVLAARVVGTWWLEGSRRGGLCAGWRSALASRPALAALSSSAMLWGLLEQESALCRQLARKLLFEDGPSALQRWRKVGPTDAPSLESLKSAIGESLQSCFGEWETTANLIDRAVKTLTEEVEYATQQQELKITREVAALREEMTAQITALGAALRPTPARLPKPSTAAGGAVADAVALYDA
jgi:hypothetical protein